MLKNAIYYVLGIVVFGWIVANITRLVLGYMPYVAVGLLIALPFYGMYRQKKKLQDKKFGIKRFVVAFAGYFKFSKRSWTFYLILGTAIGFVYEDLIWKMIMTLSWCLVGLLSFWILWEGTRLAIKKFAKMEVSSFGEALKSGWN